MMAPGASGLSVDVFTLRFRASIDLLSSLC